MRPCTAVVVGDVVTVVVADAVKLVDGDVVGDVLVVSVEVIEVVEVIIADGANETTEVIRFTKELEFNNLMARIILF